ncbi:unnamed protein product [Dovyalis caffra]|uniref:Uncharacterized protein n=1 Tax=Dovyalis caffra TaxID=77055 RepID=A0AAV1SLE5_9ROSI|nr:unnamed protein product [Dovyalis caffra]
MAGHGAYFSLIGVLVALIPLKYGTVSVFQTHHVIIAMFFVSVLVYVLASACEVILGAAQLRSIAASTSLLAKILALVLLMIILDPKMGWLLMFLWTLLFIWRVYTSREELSQLCESLYNAVLQAGERLYNAVLQAYGRHGMAEEPNVVQIEPVYAKAGDIFRKKYARALFEEVPWSAIWSVLESGA